jgi:5-methylcytosine-specific restriction endonuclease McrA
MIINASEAPKWESLFLEEIGKRHGAQFRTLAKDLIDWSQTWAYYPRFGEGTQKANYFPYLDDKNKNTCPFSIYIEKTKVSIQIQFKRLAKLKAFQDKNRLLELFNKLNRIDGVKISEDKIKTGKPPIEMNLLLKPGSLRQFKETIEWAVNLIIKEMQSAPIPEEVFKRQYETEQREARKLSAADLLTRAQQISGRPVFREVISRQARRNGYISECAKTRAEGVCQLCEKNAPFCNRENDPYLETHHIQWLSKNGLDSIDNVVALCPNCHRKMHVLDLEEDKQYLKKKIGG